ncbi:MAG TPA: GAF domain-containing protein, partial [Candidatus Limnocylindrales bacterium]
MALALDDSTPLRRRRATRRQQAAPDVGTHEARAVALRRIVAEVNGTLELDAVLEDVLDSSQELFGADAAGLWQLQPRRQPFELVASRDLGQELIDEVAAVHEDDDVMGLRAMRERRPIVIADPAAAPRFGPVYERLGFRTVNFVPLLFRDEHVGLLVLYHRTPYDWSPDELELCASFAHQMATAFANARLFARVRAGNARLRAIQELSSRLNRIQQVEKIGDAIVAEADRLINHDTIRVYTVD